MSQGFVGSIESEFRRYKALAEGTFEQLTTAEIGEPPAPGQSSVATLVWHISGNLTSRFTDFLTTDGEKPWRERESEFEARRVGRDELIEKWEVGWVCLFDTLAGLEPEQLDRTVSIRRVDLTVREALHRALAHASYHVGQVVLIGKMFRGEDWKSLSIPPGESSRYALAPDREK